MRESLVLILLCWATNPAVPLPPPVIRADENPSFANCDPQDNCADERNCEASVGPINSPSVDPCLDVSLTLLSLESGKCKVATFCKQDEPCFYSGSITFTYNAQLPQCSGESYKIIDHLGQPHILDSNNFIHSVSFGQGPLVMDCAADTYLAFSVSILDAEEWTLMQDWRLVCCPCRRILQQH